MKSIIDDILNGFKMIFPFALTIAVLTFVISLVYKQYGPLAGAIGVGVVIVFVICWGLGYLRRNKHG